MKFRFYLLFIFHLLAFKGLTQDVCENQIMKTKKTLDLYISNQYRNFSKDTDAINILSVPIFNIVFDTSIFKSANEIQAFLQIDSSKYFGIIKKNGDVVAIFDTRLTSYPSFTTTDDIRNLESLKDIQVIKYVLKFSSNPFFINLYNEHGEESYVVAYLDKNIINFILFDKTQTSNFDTLIIKEYGSVEKYKELQNVKLEKHELLLKKMSSLEKAKEIIRNDYLSFEKAFPEDTLIALNLLINEIDTSVTLTLIQKALLKERILKRIRLLKLNDFFSTGISFYGEDITSVVSSVLTQDKLCKYIEWRSLNAWLVSQAKNKIFIYLRDKNVQLDQINKEFYKEVFQK